MHVIVRSTARPVSGQLTPCQVSQGRQRRIKLELPAASCTNSLQQPSSQIPLRNIWRRVQGLRWVWNCAFGCLSSNSTDAIESTGSPLSSFGTVALHQNLQLLTATLHRYALSPVKGRHPQEAHDAQDHRELCHEAPKPREQCKLSEDLQSTFDICV